MQVAPARPQVSIVVSFHLIVEAASGMAATSSSPSAAAFDLFPSGLLSGKRLVYVELGWPMKWIRDLAPPPPPRRQVAAQTHPKTMLRSQLHQSDGASQWHNSLFHPAPVTFVSGPAETQQLLSLARLACSRQSSWIQASPTIWSISTRCN